MKVFKLTRSRIILLIVFILLIGSVLCLLRFGIKIDDVSYGEQHDLVTQKYEVENSHFYQHYFDNDSLVILNYWATWCKPCIEEMPMLNEVKKQYVGDNITFISLSVDNDSIKLANFLASNKFDFKDVTSQNRSYRTAIMNILRGKKADQWIGSYVVPMTFIIKNKKVLENIDGTIEKDELIKMIEKHK